MLKTVLIQDFLIKISKKIVKETENIAGHCHLFSNIFFLSVSLSPFFSPYFQYMIILSAIYSKRID